MKSASTWRNGIACGWLMEVRVYEGMISEVFGRCLLDPCNSKLI